jgi:hypothetical protein
MIWLVYLLFCHWVADFICQTDWMAQNKSHDVKALIIHCLVYGAVMGTMMFNIQFGFWCFMLHVPVDFVTSKINKKLWDDKNIHWFFVSVGFDQWIHAVVLIWLCVNL